MNIWSIIDLFALSCLACGGNAGRGLPLCPGCEQDLPRIPCPCPACALPLVTDPAGGPASDPATGTAKGNDACPACRKRRPFSGIAVAATAYAYPVDALVQQLKFGGRQPVARVLGRLLATSVQARYAADTLPSALLPVPLHTGRLRERGFNQAERIARAAAGILRLPLATNAVLRTRGTMAQSGLDLRRRRDNLQGAFVVTAPLPAHVAIVDDVVTSGSTVLSLAATLAAAGAERIDVWAVARTLPGREDPADTIPFEAGPLDPAALIARRDDPGSRSASSRSSAGRPA